MCDSIRLVDNMQVKLVFVSAGKGLVIALSKTDVLSIAEKKQIVKSRCVSIHACVHSCMFCICVYTYLHIYIHTYTHTYIKIIHTYIYVYIHT
jgi:hypothetical protein